MARVQSRESRVSLYETILDFSAGSRLITVLALMTARWWSGMTFARAGHPNNASLLVQLRSSPILVIVIQNFLEIDRVAV